MLPNKSILQSKVFWVNAVTLLIGLIGFMAAHPVIAAHPQWVAGLVSVQAIVNILLRLVTDTPIRLG